MIADACKPTASDDMTCARDANHAVVEGTLMPRSARASNVAGAGGTSKDAAAGPNLQRLDSSNEALAAPAVGAISATQQARRRDANNKTPASRRRASAGGSAVTWSGRTTPKPINDSANPGTARTTPSRRRSSNDGEDARQPASSNQSNASRRNRSAADLPFASVLETALSPAGKARADKIKMATPTPGSSAAAADPRASTHNKDSMGGRPSHSSTVASSPAPPAKKTPRHEDNSLSSFEILFRSGSAAAAAKASAAKASAAKASTAQQAPKPATSVPTASGPTSEDSHQQTRRPGVVLASAQGNESEHTSLRSPSKDRSSRALSEFHPSEAKDDRRDTPIRSAASTQVLASSRRQEEREKSRSNGAASTATSGPSVTKASLMHLVLPHRRRAPYRPTPEPPPPPPPRVGGAKKSSQQRLATAAPSPPSGGPNLDATAALLARIRERNAAAEPAATVEKRTKSSESTPERPVHATTPAVARKNAAHDSAAAASLPESARLSPRAVATTNVTASAQSASLHDPTSVKRRKKRRSESEGLLLQQSKFRDMGSDESPDSGSPARSGREDAWRRAAGSSGKREHVPSSEQQNVPSQGRPRGRPPGSSRIREHAPSSNQQSAPPLKRPRGRPPKTAKASLGADRDESPRPEAPSTKRPRGRPKGSTNVHRPSVTANASLGADRDEPLPEAPTKRPRGRPKGSKNVGAQRPRGRPPANAKASLGADYVEPLPEGPTKRPRGRPKTKKNVETERPRGRPRGRPPKAASALGADHDEPIPEPPTKRSRGRPKASTGEETQPRVALHSSCSSSDSPARERHATWAKNSDRGDETQNDGEIQGMSPVGRALAHSNKAPTNNAGFFAGSKPPATQNSSRHSAHALPGDTAVGDPSRAPTNGSPRHGPQESTRSVPLFIHSARPKIPPSVRTAFPGRPSTKRLSVAGGGEAAAARYESATGAATAAKGGAKTTAHHHPQQHAYVPCGSCRGCQLAIDCGSCLPCKQTINYVGLNLLRPTCIHRVCTSPVLRQVPKSDDVTSLDGDVDSFLEGDLSDVSCA